MPVDTSLAGIRATFLTSIFGRRLALDASEFLVGPKDLRVQVEGVSLAGSTLVSTSVVASLSNYGVSLVGASGASATTAYNLSAPSPGVRKVLFNPTTGGVTILTSGANLISTGGITSTQAIITFVGKGNFVELIGLTTALWGVIADGGIASVQLSSAASTASSVTRNVTYS